MPAHAGIHDFLPGPHVWPIRHTHAAYYDSRSFLRPPAGSLFFKQAAFADISMTGNLRLLGRLLAAVIFTLPSMALQSLLLRLPGRGREKFARLYWSGIRRILGLHLTVIGDLAPGRPVLFIANHCSWIDIVALGSVLPGCFVSKADVARWPLIGWIAKLGRTIFVSRTKAAMERERDGMNRRLAAGDNIILFPEGTTSDGTRILKFQSGFLAIAEAPARPAIQVVTIVYDRLDGLPVRRRDRPLISWYGDMDMASHFPGIGRCKSFHATLVLDPPIPFGAFANRKVLSAAIETRLTHNAAGLRQGKILAPAPITLDAR
jgi:1-acyl-sn-glycerol-3-phosphate acyltransferase